MLIVVEQALIMETSLMGIRCQTCEGTGKVSLRIDSTETLANCRQCNGTGVDHQTSLIGVECKRCHGTGKILQKVLTY